MASSPPVASTWKSSLVPSTIRRPWRVFDEDLEYRLGDEPADPDAECPEAAGAAPEPAELDPELERDRQLHLEVQAEGSLAVFLRLPEVRQRSFAEVSIMELAAFVSWCRKQAGRRARPRGSRRGSGSESEEDSAAELQEDWDMMDGGDKADFVPADARATLASEPDGRWMPLLCDGPPPCVAPAASATAAPTEAPMPLPAPMSSDVATPTNTHEAQQQQQQQQEQEAAASAAVPLPPTSLSSDVAAPADTHQAQQQQQQQQQQPEAAASTAAVPLPPAAPLSSDVAAPADIHQDGKKQQLMIVDCTQPAHYNVIEPKENRAIGIVDCTEPAHDSVIEPKEAQAAAEENPEELDSDSDLDLATRFSPAARKRPVAAAASAAEEAPWTNAAGAAATEVAPDEAKEPSVAAEAAAATSTATAAAAAPAPAALAAPAQEVAEVGPTASTAEEAARTATKSPAAPAATEPTSNEAKEPSAAAESAATIVAAGAEVAPVKVKKTTAAKTRAAPKTPAAATTPEPCQGSCQGLAVNTPVKIGSVATSAAPLPEVTVPTKAVTAAAQTLANMFSTRSQAALPQRQVDNEVSDEEDEEEASSPELLAARGRRTLTTRRRRGYREAADPLLLAMAAGADEADVRAAAEAAAAAATPKRRKRRKTHADDLQQVGLGSGAAEADTEQATAPKRARRGTPARERASKCQGSKPVQRSHTPSARARTPKGHVSKPIQRSTTAKLRQKQQPGSMSNTSCSDNRIWRCCVCDGAGANRDVILCDGCEKGFHLDCHDPPVTNPGSATEKWYCAGCTEMIARRRGLLLRPGDVAWAKMKAGTEPWPCCVIKLDFTSEEDDKPYWVQFFSHRPGAEVTGAWMSTARVVPWKEGPNPGNIRESRRRAAVQVAVAELEASSLPPATAPVRKSEGSGSAGPGSRSTPRQQRQRHGRRGA
eukprot:TRINITY_DN2134_c0_g1_i1.p1 TRINITY_DN2134_c0_g1~~TRINITY_DN2134_c0_g1_i1.p1  ORF type:complete len:938 (-),score=227.14 TRINITY_DN2134_c0_g1_i1:117-2930(-)